MNRWGILLTHIDISFVKCLKICSFARFCRKFTKETDDKFEKTVFDNAAVVCRWLDHGVGTDFSEGQRSCYVC